MDFTCDVEVLKLSISYYKEKIFSVFMLTSRLLLLKWCYNYVSCYILNVLFTT